MVIDLLRSGNDVACARDNEKAEPASIDGEYGGGAFSSYNRVHVTVSPIKADPMGFGSSVPTGRSSPTLKARG